MTQEQLMKFYAELLSGISGKTDKAKLDYAKGYLGFNPFEVGGQQNYVPAVAPDMSNPVGDVWGNDPAYTRMFELIQKGSSPAVAYQTASDEGYTFSGVDPYSNKGVDPLQIANAFATKEAELDQAQKRFDLEQAQAASLFEAKRSPTFSQDVFGQTAYDKLAQAAGGDLTAQDLTDMYAKKRLESLPKSPDRASMLAAQRVGSSVKPSYSSDKGLQGYYENVSNRLMGKALESAKQKFVPTEKGLEMLRMLASLRAGGK